MFRCIKNTIPHIAGIVAGMATFKVLNDNGVNEPTLIIGTGVAAGITDTVVTIGINSIGQEKPVPNQEMPKMDVPIMDDLNDEEEDETKEENNKVSIADAIEYFEEELQEASGSEETYNKLLDIINNDEPESPAISIIILAFQDMYDFEAFGNTDEIINRAKQLFFNLGLISDPDAQDEEEVHEDEDVQKGDEKHVKDSAQAQDSQSSSDTDESEKFAGDFVEAAEEGDEKLKELMDSLDHPKDTIPGSVLEFAQEQAGDPPVSEEKAQRNQRRANNKAKGGSKQSRLDRRFK